MRAQRQCLLMAHPSPAAQHVVDFRNGIAMTRLVANDAPKSVQLVEAGEVGLGHDLATITNAATQIGAAISATIGTNRGRVFSSCSMAHTNIMNRMEKAAITHGPWLTL